jgi:hypothetical protein
MVAIATGIEARPNPRNPAVVTAAS